MYSKYKYRSKRSEKLKVENVLLKFSIVIFLCLNFSSVYAINHFNLVKEIKGDISPKSIVFNNHGVFAAQNMMYRHSITFYNQKGELIKTLNDNVDLKSFGFERFNEKEYKGAPVEAAFTPDGKYLWVSNYAMYGKEFGKEGCDNCVGSEYDKSFLYKINTDTYQIEKIIEVGAVPKFISISKNGRLLIVSNWTSSNISIVNLDNDKLIGNVDIGKHPRGIAIDNKNQIAYVTVMGSNKIAKVNLITFKVSYIENVGKSPRHLVLNNSNDILYLSVNSENKLLRINLISGKRQYCKTKSGPRSMVLSENEKFLYVVNYYANTFQKIDAFNFEVIATQATKHHPIGITGNWSNGDIWVACYSGTIQIFNDVNFNRGKKNEDEIKLNNVQPLKRQTESIKKESVFARKVIMFEADDTPKTCLFYLIAGSFQEKGNATILKKSLIKKGFKAEILPSRLNGMHMVSMACFPSLKSAEHNLFRYRRDKHIDAWIFKKKKLTI